MTNKPSTRKNPPDHKHRELILNELDQNLLVEAAAGTGKTTSMVGRMVALLQTGKCADVSNLSAITFTRKAAAELRARFQVALERAVNQTEGVEQQRLQKALGRVEQCFVGTIHSFCGRLLRERPVEGGVDLEFQELDEDEDELIRKEAWSEFQVSFITGDNLKQLEQIEDLGLQLGQLEDFFVEFARFPDVDSWPLPSIEAQAPNTANLKKQLLRFIEHIKKLNPKLPSDYGKDQLVPLYRTIPRKAAHFDLKKRPDLIAVMGLFNRRLPDGTVKVTKWERTGNFTRQDARDELARYNAFFDDMVTPFFNALYEERYAPIMRILIDAQKVYDRIRAQRHKLNFQDLLLKSAALLRSKPHIRQYFAGRFTHLLVDEFHDTDPVQAEMMLLLTATDPAETNWRKCIPRPGSLFVVGDPKQSIYRFRRADIVTYNDVKEILSRNGQVLQLSANFRSSGQIIDWVNEVFDGTDSIDSAEDLNEPMLQFENQDTPQSPAYVALQVGHTGDSSGPLAGVWTLLLPGGGKEVIVPYEAEFIARTIRHALDTGLTIPRKPHEIDADVPETARPEDFLIVTFRKAELGQYAKALQKYDIPHVVTGGSALSEVPELKLLHVCLTAVLHPDNPVPLVATLRSALFGVSDQSLYAFKKAGGRFSYRAPLPDALNKDDAAPIQEAFQRLMVYSSWMSSLPPITAIEKIVGESGLYALAASRQGGDVQAGSLGKALEILHSAQKEIWSIGELVDHLGELANTETEKDGVSAGSDTRSTVRIMNLHKVKGLEAPVVFLACPYGESSAKISPQHHIDRSGDQTLGYLAMHLKTQGWSSNILIARPPGWAALEDAEREFLRAERLRLRYVAATRAGSSMIITQRSTFQGGNPWNYFEKYVDKAFELKNPGRQKPPARSTARFTQKSAQAATKNIERQLSEVRLPSYDIGAAKRISLARDAKKQEEPLIATEPQTNENVTAPLEHQENRGADWGSVVHAVLEAAMQNPAADLRNLATTYLVEYELSEELADAVVATVTGIIDSDLWRRANQSEQKFVEIPFHVLLETTDDVDRPTVVRGSIDLVFKEDDGWVLVDYKTDSVKNSSIADLTKKYAPQLQIYAQAWTKCTGEPVKEMGLLFSQTNEHVIL